MESQISDINSNNKSNTISDTLNSNQNLNNEPNTKDSTVIGDNITNKKPTNNQSVNEPSEDSSIACTAFTISFDDEKDTTKKLGIKDSIKKFAPPKTFTKPNLSNLGDDKQQFDSGPTSLPYKSANFSRANSHRFSQSSRHSNISESAAFLIDKMLNNSHESRTFKGRHGEDSSNISSSERKRNQQPASDNFDLDQADDKSDNGTYIVGTNPESEVARRQIDELFGVVKAAEDSILARMSDSTSDNQRSQNNLLNSKKSTRSSRVSSKQTPVSRERQEHINRLAKNPSRSSSVSRHDESPPCNSHRTSSRHSRNSSCDRQSSTKSRNRKRSISQSSRSSLKGGGGERQANMDTSNGSKSPLYQSSDERVANLSSEFASTAINPPSMKFNRAFALRRARLGLGEPTRYANENEAPQNLSTINYSSASNSPKRNFGNLISNTRQSQSASFCRDDGGRFSLRMKNNFLQSRAASAHLVNNRSSQQQQQQQQQLDGHNLVRYYHSSNRQANNPSSLAHTPTNIGSNEFSDIYDHHGNGAGSQMLMMRHGNRLVNSSKFISQHYKRSPSDLYDSDLNAENSAYSNYHNLNRPEAGDLSYESSRFSRGGTGCSYMSPSSSQEMSGLRLNPLDNLVVSAISNLSTKVRQSICDLLVDQAKKLPAENETRLVVEEILPQLTDELASDVQSMGRFEEQMEQSIHLDLSKILKNLKKMEQMVGVISLIDGKLQSPSQSPSKTTIFPTSSTSSINTLKSSAASQTGVGSKNETSAFSLIESSSNNMEQESSSTV